MKFPSILKRFIICLFGVAIIGLLIAPFVPATSEKSAKNANSATCDKSAEEPAPPVGEKIVVPPCDRGAHAVALSMPQAAPKPKNRYASLVFNEGDRDLLALLTFHETRGYGDDGYGVVETVLNRCNDSRFPDTVYEVINQEDQYISSADLWAQDIDSPEALAHCYEIVDDILNNHHYVLPDYYVWYNSIAPDNYDDYMFFGLGNYFS